MNNYEKGKSNGCGHGSKYIYIYEGRCDNEWRCVNDGECGDGGGYGYGRIEGSGYGQKNMDPDKFWEEYSKGLKNILED